MVADGAKLELARLLVDDVQEPVSGAESEAALMRIVVEDLVDVDPVEQGERRIVQCASSFLRAFSVSKSRAARSAIVAWFAKVRSAWRRSATAASSPTGRRPR